MGFFGKFFDGFNGRNTVMGLQHTFVMFGATVLVPLVTGLDVGVTLFAAGLGTIIFHIVTKFRVPVFLGSSFAFLPPITAIVAMEGGSLSLALGGVAVAGLLYIVVAIIFTFVDVRFFHSILPPQVTGPIIILIGLMLAPVAIGDASTNWGIAGFTFLLGVFVKLFFQNRVPFLSTLPVLLALVGGYIVALIAGLVDFTPVSEAQWIGLPAFSTPRFSWTAVSIALPVAVVTIVEHFGDVLAIGNVVEKDFFKNPGVNRTLLGDGIATSISALIGGPANTTYGENTGAVALTGNRNPIVMRIAALFAILISFIPKFTQIVATVPKPVIGGISILLFGMIASIGIKNMIDARLNLGNPKHLIVTAAVLVLGLGDAQLSLGSIQLQGLGFAALVGIFLNLVLNFKTFGREAQEPGAPPTANE
jgi:uracil permease